MERVDYAVTVDIPLDVIWNFIEDFDNWAPMIKGYESHEKIDEKNSIWMIRGEFGSFSRLTKFNNKITEWVEKERVAFEMTGVNEPVNGGGSVVLTPENDGSSVRISAAVGFQAGGMMGPLINRMIKPMMLTVSEELVEKIIAAIDPEEFKSDSQSSLDVKPPAAGPLVSLWRAIVSWFKHVTGS